MAAGCGNHRAKAPDFDTVQAPVGVRQFAYAQAGLRFAAPRNWAQQPDSGPGVAIVSSGRASVVIRRYRRRERLPDTLAKLQDARGALLDAVQARDRGLAVRSTRILTMDGVPGIELLADWTVDGHTSRVRSTHLFARGAEYVFDASAPEKVFARVDRTVFVPLLASVRVSSAGAAGR